MTTKPGLSRDEHTELGLEFAAMHDRLGKAAVQLGHACSVALGDKIVRIQSELNRLRSELDDIVFREYPGLSTKGNASVYYPGQPRDEATVEAP